MLMATTAMRYKDTGWSLHLSKFHHLRLTVNPKQTGLDQQGHFTHRETEAEMAESTPRSRSWPGLELGVPLRTLDSLPCILLPAEGQARTRNAVGKKSRRAPENPGRVMASTSPAALTGSLSGCSLADPGTWSQGT